MKFGNWQVTADGIKWIGNGFNQFSIPKETMTDIRRGDDGGPDHYEWILAATDESWLTQNDLYDLNYAFVYAAALSGVAFDYETFDATLEQQFEQLEEEDDSDIGI